MTVLGYSGGGQSFARRGRSYREVLIHRNRMRGLLLLVGGCEGCEDRWYCHECGFLRSVDRNVHKQHVHIYIQKIPTGIRKVCPVDRDKSFAYGDASSGRKNRPEDSGIQGSLDYFHNLLREETLMNDIRREPRLDTEGYKAHRVPTRGVNVLSHRLVQESRHFQKTVCLLCRCNSNCQGVVGDKIIFLV